MNEEFHLGPPSPQAVLASVPFQVWETPDGTRWLEFHRQPGGFILRFPDLADFAVSADGTDIRCRPALGIDEATARHLFLNQVMPLAIHARGAIALHASAVVAGEGAVAFMGSSGRGKSTLAASFATNGHPFLSDDGLVVDWHNGAAMILPSHPSIRLWDDSQAQVGGGVADLAPAVSYTTKSRLLAGGGLPHCTGPRRFQAAYVLGDGTAAEDISFMPLRPAEFLLELVKYSFQLDIEDPAGLNRHFDGLAKLCGVVPGFRLDYPRRYGDLGRLRTAILDHALAQEDQRDPQ